MNSQRRLVLASTSKYRRELLDRLGLEYTAVAPEYEEEHDPKTPHVLLARDLAKKKALSVAHRFPDALIIGSDQILSFESEVFTKPGTVKKTVDQLMRLSGHTHQLITALAVHDTASRKILSTVDVHMMYMRSHTQKALRNYVRRDQSMHCVGGYKLESLGIALFQQVRGEDDTAVIGLPMINLVGMLLKFGYPVL